MFWRYFSKFFEGLIVGLFLIFCFQKPVLGISLEEVLHSDNCAPPNVVCWDASDKQFLCLNSRDLFSVPNCDILIGSRESADACEQISNYAGHLPSPVDTSLTFVPILGKCVDMNDFLNTVASWSILLGAVISILRLGYGAWQYAWSTGKPTQLEAARDTIIYAVLGLVIIALAFVILQIGDSFVPEEWQVNFGI